MAEDTGIRIVVDPALSDLLARGADRSGQLTVLKRSVPRNSRPTLAAIVARTPVVKGQLQASFGVTTKIDASQGEVYSIVGIRDNVVVWSGGVKTLYSSLKKVKRLGRLAAMKGAAAASRSTAFTYVRGIESGFKSNGKLARRAGGAKMIERGAADTAAGFTDGVGNDMLGFILDGQGG